MPSLPWDAGRFSLSTMTTVEQQWTPASHLILGDDPQQRIFVEVTDWFKKVQLFRQQEDERMFLREPAAEDLAIHKHLLQRLILDGQHLLSLVRQVGWPENNQGIAPEAVVVEVETLRDTFRGWHEPMSLGERERLMKAMFPHVA
jgi:hypothetical protein